MPSDENVDTKEKTKKKSIHFFVEEAFHRKLKVAVAIKGTTIREYVKSLVEKDLQNMANKGQGKEL